MHCRSSELFCTKTFFVYVPGALGTVGTVCVAFCVQVCVKGDLSIEGDCVG